MLVRLEAEVLAPSPDACAKMRCCMPRPARIVERDGDQVGVPRVQDGLGLVKVGDQADPNH